MYLTDEEIKDWFTRLEETPLYKLAVYNLIRTKKAKYQTVLNTKFYTVDHLEVMLESYVIAKEANKKGINI